MQPLVLTGTLKLPMVPCTHIAREMSKSATVKHEHATELPSHRQHLPNQMMLLMVLAGELLAQMMVVGRLLMDHLRMHLWLWQSSLLAHQ